MHLEVKVAMCHRLRALNGSLPKLGGYHFCLAKPTLETWTGGYAAKLSTTERNQWRVLGENHRPQVSALA